MYQLNQYLVALSEQQSYNNNMNTDTLNILLTIFLLLPMLMIPIVLMVDLLLSRRETNRVLFGPVDRLNNRS